MTTSSGARTPEDLELLFEDALIVRDPLVLGTLFEAGATFVAGNAQPTRGGKASAWQALAIWDPDHPYLATPRRLLVTRDIALIAGAPGVQVVRRDPSGAWRFVIVWQTIVETSERQADDPDHT